MSDSPSPVVASAVQGSVQARIVSAEREVRRAEQSQAANRQAKSVDEAGVTVDTADADARVFSDAEGGGSQGRASEEPAQPDQSNLAADEPTDGVRVASDGSVHVDLQA